MNSYWAETFAREHADQLAADARGDQFLAEAGQADTLGRTRAVTPLMSRALARLRAFARRQRPVRAGAR